PPPPPVPARPVALPQRQPTPPLTINTESDDGNGTSAAGEPQQTRHPYPVMVSPADVKMAESMVDQQQSQGATGSLSWSIAYFTYGEKVGPSSPRVLLEELGL